MIIENKQFQKLLKRHKKLISTVGEWDLTKPLNSLTWIKRQSQALALYFADYHCDYENCCLSHDLTIHHLIMRDCKKLMDFKRYLGSRYYWNNQVVLCSKHHNKVHGFGPAHLSNFIKVERISKIKEFFDGKTTFSNIWK